MAKGNNKIVNFIVRGKFSFPAFGVFLTQNLIPPPTKLNGETFEVRGKVVGKAPSFLRYNGPGNGQVMAL